MPSTKQCQNTERWSSEDFFAFARQRRSTRIFQDHAVPKEKIARVVEAATLAPSSCNRQLWHFVAVTDPEVKKRVCACSDAQQSYLYDAPVLLCGFYDCSLESRNPCKTPFITMGMAFYAMLLAAEAEGLGAIYLGGIRRPQGIAEALEAPSHLTNLGMICLGYREDDPPTPPARPVADILSYETCRLHARRAQADIRPHLWSLSQLADFRDKLLWYKGVSIDAMTLHVDPDRRCSPKFRFMTGKLGMLCSKYHRPKVLDVFSHNGDLLLQLLNARGEDLSRLYAYDLTEGILEFIKVRLKASASNLDRVDYLVNSEEERIHIPLDDEQVDVISCYERLEHLENPQPLVDEMYRVLRPGGRAMVVVSNRLYPHLYRYRRTRRHNYALGRNWNHGPEKKFEPWVIQQAFKQAGFRVVDSVGLQPIEKKLFHLLFAGCKSLGLSRMSERFEQLSQQTYIASSWSKYTSSSVCYELSRE